MQLNMSHNVGEITALNDQLAIQLICQLHVHMYTILLFEFRKLSQFGNKSCMGRLHGSLETTNSDLLEHLDED